MESVTRANQGCCLDTQPIHSRTNKRSLHHLLPTVQFSKRAFATSGYGITDVLLSPAGYKTRSKLPPAYEAILAGDLEGLQKCVQNSNMDINKQPFDVNLRLETLLHFASDHGQCEIARYLLSIGAKLEPRNIHGETPIEAAVYKGHFDIVVLLMNHEGSPTPEKATNLLVPALYGNQARILKLLLHYGADPNYIFYDISNRIYRTPGRTVLCLAVDNIDPDALKALLENAGDPMRSTHPLLPRAINKRLYQSKEMTRAAQTRVLDLIILLSKVQAPISKGTYQAKFIERLCKEIRLRFKDNPELFNPLEQPEIRSSSASQGNTLRHRLPLEEEDADILLLMPDTSLQQKRAEELENIVAWLKTSI